MDYAEEQRQRWNGAAGHAWAASQAVLDRPFEPLADRLADLAAARRPDQLLNVCLRDRSRSSRLRSLRARRRGPLHRRVLDGERARSRRGRCSGDVTMSRISWTSERVKGPDSIERHPFS
jgi:hypothetical protein